MCAATRNTSSPKLAFQTAALAVTVLVIVPAGDDQRIEAARDAVSFWNARLEELGVATRLGEPRIAVAPPELRAIENYARSVAQRAARLPAGQWEPDAPAEVTHLDADVILLLSAQDILSYAWPLPRVDPPRYLVVIRSVRGPDRGDAMVTRHVVAHELGHTLGLLHNNEPDTLMCGPCQPLASTPDATGYLPLTDAERARLRALHP